MIIDKKKYIFRAIIYYLILVIFLTFLYGLFLVNILIALPITYLYIKHIAYTFEKMDYQMDILQNISKFVSSVYTEESLPGNQNTEVIIEESIRKLKNKELSDHLTQTLLINEYQDSLYAEEKIDKTCDRFPQYQFFYLFLKQFYLIMNDKTNYEEKRLRLNKNLIDGLEQFDNTEMYFTLKYKTYKYGSKLATLIFIVIALGFKLFDLYSKYYNILIIIFVLLVIIFNIIKMSKASLKEDIYETNY